MKKSELKTGMKVVTRDGFEYIVFKDTKHKYSEDTIILLSNTGNLWNSLNHLNDNLIDEENTDEDIMFVYEPNHIYEIGNFFGSNNHEHGWELIYKREDKINVDNTINVSDTNEMEELIWYVKH